MVWGARKPIWKPIWPLMIQLTLGVILIGLNQNNPFFWDTVQLASKHAHFFFENGLNWQALPPAIDSGHPPSLGFYLAGCWHWFGKSLWVSHWAMAPFFLLNIYLLWRLGRHIGSAFGALFLPFLVLADPVFLTQHILISPDQVVVTGFLLAVNGILASRQIALMAGVLLMCAFSMRGMMTAFGLGLWCLFLNRQRLNQWRTWIRISLPFVPGVAFMLWFLIWHSNNVGWTGYHPDSPWAGAFKIVDFQGFLRNGLILGWRWLDFGRVGVWAAFICLIWQQRRNLRTWRLEHSRWGVLWLCMLLTLSPTALLYQNLSAHRYFLPAFLACSFGVFDLMQRAGWKSWKMTILIVFFISGHLWIYPAGISNDWDCTLAHQPFYTMQKDVRQHLTSQEVDFSTVGSAFPDLNTAENLFLNGDERLFSPIDFEKNQWVLASNIFNDLEKDDLSRLSKEWRLAWSQQQGMVWMRLYQKK